MLVSDTRKLISRLLILMVLVSWLALLRGSSLVFFFSSIEGALAGSIWSTRANQIPAQTPIKVTVDQLPADNGLAPLEIQQVQISSSKSDQIESVSYLVKNNTNKKITAFTVAQSITYEENGTEYTETISHTAEYELHPDFNETSRKKNLSPGEIDPMESAGPISFGEGTIIKEVRLRIDYAQFADGSVLGSGSEGERQVKLAREGASRYKTWLKERYVQSGKSLTIVLNLLQNEDVPEELGLKDSSQILGAKNYRLRLLKIFRTDDPAKIQKYLNR